MTRRSGRQQKILEEILKDVMATGEYDAVLLSDSDGLVLAARSAGRTETTVAAVTALLRDVAAQAREQLSLEQVNELSLVDDDRSRFVCRFFRVDGGGLLNLALVVPPDRAYRRVTNQAIHRIQQAWNEM